MKICLIGATHISYNPRLVREADTLTQEGHDVRVVAPCFDNQRAEFDQRLLWERSWRFQPFDYRARGALSRLHYWTVRGVSRVQEQTFRLLNNPRVAEGALLPGAKALERRAMSEESDWFIAHAQPALAPAARAAARQGARLGFDMEDILTLSPEEPVELLKTVEEQYLPAAEYVSVPSDAIARRLLDDYPDLNTVTLYNVFPRRLAGRLRPPAERKDEGRDRPIRLHWFGQTIGPGRGLRRAIEALAPLAGRVELHCRGANWHSGFQELKKLATARGVPFIHHPLIEHDLLIENMETFDVGLALEQPASPHYELTVTNKFFSYLLAGLAIAATATSGQREIWEKVPEIGFLFDHNRPEVLTRGLEKWIDHPDRLLTAKTAAWTAAQERYCWDVEKERFLGEVGK